MQPDALVCLVYKRFLNIAYIVDFMRVAKQHYKGKTTNKLDRSEFCFMTSIDPARCYME